MIEKWIIIMQIYLFNNAAYFNNKILMFSYTSTEYFCLVAKSHLRERGN